MCICDRHGGRHAALIACDLKPAQQVLASRDVATTGLLIPCCEFWCETSNVDFSDLDAVREKARELRPQVLIAETISNHC